MLFFGEGQLRKKGFVFSSEEGEKLQRGKNLQKTKWEKQSLSFGHRCGAGRREVKVGGLCRISIWDFMQVAVVVTRVLEIRFDSLRASAVRSFSRCLAPWKSVFLWQGRRRVCLGSSCFEIGYARLIMV
ncbi:unnamed protein product [Prunus armeniaca]